MARDSAPKAGERKNVVGTEKVMEKYRYSQPELVSSGIFYFDILLGGGIPRGSFIEIASDSGLGKSTLIGNISRNLCAVGEKVLWLDFEHALTGGLKEGLGLIPYCDSLFTHLEPVTYGDAEEIMEGITEKDLPNFIVVDSETGMLVDKMQDTTILTMEPGLKSRLSSNFLQKYKGWCRKHQITMIFINQMRTKIGFGFGQQTTVDSAGGNALKFYCDIRLRLKKKSDIVRQEDTPEGKKKITYGIEVAIWAIKNKEARSHVELTFPIIFGRGVSNIQILKNILESAGYISTSGAYYRIGLPGIHEGNVQGNKGLFIFIREHKKEIEAFIKEKDLIFLSRCEED